MLTILLMTLLTTPRIILTLQTAEENAAMVGITVEFIDEAGAFTGQCTSDSNGQCEIHLTGQSTSNTVRGYLDLGPSGKRSLIFNTTEDVTLTLYFNEYGQLVIPGHDAHPTVQTFTNQATPLPAQQPAATPTARPTTEFVVIDPHSSLPIEATEVPLILPTTEQPLPTLTLTTPPTTTTPTPTASIWQIAICTTLFALLWGGGLFYIWRKNHA